jgi:hypothetical protein
MCIGTTAAPSAPLAREAVAAPEYARVSAKEPGSGVGAGALDAPPPPPPPQAASTSALQVAASKSRARLFFV